MMISVGRDTLRHVERETRIHYAGHIPSNLQSAVRQLEPALAGHSATVRVSIFAAIEVLNALRAVDPSKLGKVDRHHLDALACAIAPSEARARAKRAAQLRAAEQMLAHELTPELPLKW